MSATALLDTFALDNLPPPDLQPAFINLDRLCYPDEMNAAVELVDRHVAEGRGDRTALIAPGVRWTYGELAERVDRIANVLVDDLGLVPGGRVLLRSANNPMLAASILAVLKAGGIVVATMPLLRAKELGKIVEKGRIGLALSDAALTSDLEAAAPDLRIVTWTGHGKGDLGRLASHARPHFAACRMRASDPCLFGFTSGTTGEPKATVHFHRDLLAVCDTYAKHILRPEPDDVFIGSPPLAFTFGLGGLLLFPLRAGAAAVLLEQASPKALARGIEEHRATIAFTAPTAYRAILAEAPPHASGSDLSSLRKCVSAGEALPEPTFRAWKEATGLPIMDGIGSTEMLHIFIGAREEDIRPGSTGLPVPGYEARVIDAEGRPCPPGVTGRLAVRGPTGCRYLADERQRAYVENGWNVTGDAYAQDEDGYFWFKARADDMIVSAGYNIAGPEVEASLLGHEAVAECGVVAAPDGERGSVVKAYVLLKAGFEASPALAASLQEHVKAEIAPYKYPRAVVFVDSLPKTATGKLQRFALRERAAREAQGGEAA